MNLSTPAIPELHRTDRAVEELVRIVQECGDAIRRRDERLIIEAVAEWKVVSESIADVRAVDSIVALHLARDRETESMLGATDDNVVQLKRGAR